MALAGSTNDTVEILELHFINVSQQGRGQMKAATAYLVVLWFTVYKFLKTRHLASCSWKISRSVYLTSPYIRDRPSDI